MIASPIAQNSTDRDTVLMELLAGQSRHPHLGQIAIALRDNLLNIYGDQNFTQSRGSDKYCLGIKN